MSSTISQAWVARAYPLLPRERMEWSAYTTMDIAREETLTRNKETGALDKRMRI